VSGVSVLSLCYVAGSSNADPLRNGLDCRTITPIKVTHEFTLQFYFSVWGEDATGKPLPKDGPGRLRKAILTQGTIILSVSPAS
jgi:hypothetical protein